MRAGRVYLVGAGPGNPGLLTLRAAECLRQADLVLYDRLVAAPILAHAPRARKVCVTELPGEHPERWPHINATMIDAARQGDCVVRLKGGDPMLFGRGAEEAEALREAGIPFEFVPGVTAALGAASFAGIPLTHRLHASAVAFVTGHEDPGKDGSLLDWPALARFPGTLVFYMVLARLERLVSTLIENGKDPGTPAALIQSATRGCQRTIETTLERLPQTAQGAALGSPTLGIIGSVVSLRQSVAWFESLPLFGRSVLVTRPAHQAAEMVRKLEALGATVHCLPTIEIREPADWAPVDRALAELRDYDWLVFTSANGVHRFIRRLREVGQDLRSLGNLRLATIGPATADALREYHLEPDVIPPEYRAESLAACLRERVIGQRVLYCRADRGREVLQEELSRVARVGQVAVYSQVDVLEPDLNILGLLREGKIDYVTLTSSNIARALARLLLQNTPVPCSSLPGGGRLVTISPVTSAAVRELGWPVAAEAVSYTVDGLVEALIDLALREKGGKHEAQAPLDEGEEIL